MAATFFGAAFLALGAACFHMKREDNGQKIGISECPTMNECEFQEIWWKKIEKNKKNMGNIVEYSVGKIMCWNHLFRSEIGTNETE